MSLRKITLLAFAVLGVIGVSYVVYAGNASHATPVVSGISLDKPAAARGMMTTDQLITFWRGRFERDPHDFISLTFLGAAFISKGRETGDVSQYNSAEAALDKALSIAPSYDTASAYLSAVRYVKHDFSGALDLANQLHAINPTALQPLATMADAQLELGNYAAAEDAYRQLASLNTGPAVLSRLARLAWLEGQPEAAIQKDQQAVDAAAQWGLTGENAAWYRLQLGDLYFNTGQIDKAETQYNASLASLDNYYLALAALGKVRAAQGRYEESIQYYQRAIAIVPQPDFLAALGDVYATTGQPDQAQSQYRTVEFIAKLAAINQVIYNRQLAMFDANHDQRLSEALDLASREAAVRQDIYSYDTLAWAQYKNGHYAEASMTIQQAMKLGTPDALLYYHAGMIAAGLGDVHRAQALLSQALVLNPHFDLLQARNARSTLAGLDAR